MPASMMVRPATIGIKPIKRMSKLSGNEGRAGYLAGQVEIGEITVEDADEEFEGEGKGSIIYPCQMSQSIARPRTEAKLSSRFFCLPVSLR